MRSFSHGRRSFRKTCRSGDTVMSSLPTMIRKIFRGFQVFLMSSLLMHLVQVKDFFARILTQSKEWSEDAVALCSKRQRRILSDVWPALKTGGILIYSTCTYNSQENEENLKWLQQEYEVESIPLENKEGMGNHYRKR